MAWESWDHAREWGYCAESVVARNAITFMKRLVVAVPPEDREGAGVTAEHVDPHPYAPDGAACHVEQRCCACCDALLADVADAHAREQASRARDREVLAEHPERVAPPGQPSYCRTCARYFPCRTVRVLRRAETEAA